MQHSIRVCTVCCRKNILNFFVASVDFFPLQKVWTQIISYDLDPNCLTLFEQEVLLTTTKHEKLHSMQRVQELKYSFLCPQRNFGRHIVIALSVRPSVLLRVWCISPIFFEVGIPNLVCGCILGWRSVAYHFWVTVTLTSDLVFRIIMSGAYLLYHLR